ncbi:MAG: hypothetical protein H5T86_11300 [Armatimonadetes bacterium]|nr:hypothetical protein [Armatimonadota bacterium]
MVSADATASIAGNVRTVRDFGDPMEYRGDARRLVYWPAPAGAALFF